MTSPLRRHRRLTARLSVGLLLVWGLVSFVVPFYARELSWTVGGWPLSFWMAAQGSIVIYIVIVAVYANVMDRLDNRYQEALSRKEADASGE